ncbi:MAG: hypothetical protein K2X93_10275 [Candidatus Obscuribacterales bacterium]|nr:hypothetical protein [Candidatus Obscuribacterales bacterium]
MRTIPKERILRVNCPGYGTDAHWNLGRAKSLNSYSAIIVNPVSIAHLFDKDPELVRKVDQSLAEGQTTIAIDDDLLLRNLSAEVDSRILELSDFLTQGGVLVYFLCRPFLIQGPSIALDNYYWLESLVPDQPVERNVRHMSAVSHGRLIEPTEDGMTSEFSQYLQQHGLEWSTLIRSEYLTEGYNVLAEAGARKCIAGQLFIVESSGKVVFLPSPYSPDFDKTLIDCLNRWYQTKDPSPEELEAEHLESQVALAYAAQSLPQAGPVLFDRDQANYEPIASAQMDVTPAAPAPQPELQTAQAVTPAPQFETDLSMIAETVSQEARRFEEAVANRVAQEPQKKNTTSIDLSIFAQTARQLVQQANQPEPQVEEMPMTTPSATVENQPEPPSSNSDDLSTGSHGSLRSILSDVAPSLPSSVHPENTAPSVLAMEEEVEFDQGNNAAPSVEAAPEIQPATPEPEPEPQPVLEQPPVRPSEPVRQSHGGLPAAQFTPPTPKSMSALFSDDDEFATSAAANTVDPSSDSGFFNQIASASPQPSQTHNGPADEEFEFSEPESPTTEEATAPPVDLPAFEQPSIDVPEAPTPAPKLVSPDGDSAVTSNNNDPSNHENKSTMDLLRELEKAQRPLEPQPTSQPTMPAPGGDGMPRPVLNSFVKKDTSDFAVQETARPIVAPSINPPTTYAQPPAAAQPKSTLGALTQPAEPRASAPQAPVIDANKENSYMSNMNVPDWCRQYSFSYLDELKKEQSTLASQLQDVQAKLNTVDSKIASVEQLKCALLAGEGEALKEASGLVLARLGWSVNHGSTPNEVLLLNVDLPEALVRIVRSEAHCDRSEVAQVSGAAIAFWEKHDIEPKGLLIACTWANVSPQARTQRDFEDAVAEFARKKNLCLMTTLQMIGIYRDLELGIVTADVVRKQMLDTNGCLTGYTVEAPNMVGARA